MWPIDHSNSSFRAIVAGLSLGDIVEARVGKKRIENICDREWSHGKIRERSSNMDDMWMGVKDSCKDACDTLSHAVHVNKVQCAREKVSCEVFCLQSERSQCTGRKQGQKTKKNASPATHPSEHLHAQRRRRAPSMR